MKIMQNRFCHLFGAVLIAVTTNAGCAQPPTANNAPAAPAVTLPVAVRRPVTTDPLVAQKPLSAYVTSWFGNTSPLQSDHIQSDVGGMHVRADGTVYVVQHFNEGDSNVGIYRDGKRVGGVEDFVASAWGRTGGHALTSDDRYLYVAMVQGGGYDGPPKYPAEGTHWHVVRRYTLDGKRAPFAEGVLWDKSGILVNTGGQNISGIAHHNGELFVSDPTGEGAIKVFDAASGVLKREWKTAHPHALVLESAKTLWILQTDDKGARILHQSLAGKTLPGSFALPKSLKAASMSLDARGRLLIVDSGPEQNVKIFDLKTRRQVGVFGVKGGIYAGPTAQIGRAREKHFNGPSAVGVDAQGRIYIGSAGAELHDQEGSATLECYAPTGKRQWIAHGLEFVSVADVDPANIGNVYSLAQRYRVDFDKARSNATEPWNNNSHWTHVATTLNPFKYPDDARNHGKFGIQATPWVRRIEGKTFLFITGMYPDVLGIYRFNAATDGEIAIPCGLFSPRNLNTKSNEIVNPDGKWLASQPAKGEWIWRDGDGAGDFEAAEFERKTENADSDAPGLWGWWVDEGGNIWQAAENGQIRRFQMLGLDANGTPRYSFSSVETWQAPAPFNGLQRIEYSTKTDTLILAGYSAQHPRPDGEWGLIGTVLARYDNWSKGNRTAKWTMPIPRPPRAAGGFGGQAVFIPKAMASAGDYVFVAYYNAQRTPLTKVFDARNGTHVGDMIPHYAGKSLEGDVDTPYGLRAFQRKNGEYIVIQEYDIVNKILIYLWRPEDEPKSE